MGLLKELVESARERAKKLPRREPPLPLKGLSLEEAIRGKDRLDVIAEFKRRSPSLGSIADRDLETRVRAFERAGAAAISVLTEPTRFDGRSEDLAMAALAVKLPVLMKDFVVDPAQVREAAWLGARGVLLIARCLSRTELEELVSACSSYGLTPLIECHEPREIERAIGFEGAVIGANNRDLETLAIDRALAPRLLEEVPSGRVTVAESGYESASDIAPLRGLADAVLVGSALMRQSDPEALLREIRG